MTPPSVRRAEDRPRHGSSSETLSSLERILLHVATFLVAASGLSYAWMKYVMAAPDDPFSIVGHPLQPHVLHLHVLTAPLLVLVLGMIFREHILARLGNQRRRRAGRSGKATALLLAPLIASGYLLQTATSEGWRRALVAAHLISGAAYLIVYALHLVSGRSSTRRDRRGAHGMQPRGSVEIPDLHLRRGLGQPGNTGR